VESARSLSDSNSFDITPGMMEKTHLNEGGIRAMQFYKLASHINADLTPQGCVEVPLRLPQGTICKIHKVNNISYLTSISALRINTYR